MSTPKLDKCWRRAWLSSLAALLLVAIPASSQTTGNAAPGAKSAASSVVGAELAPGSAHVISPEELVTLLQSKTAAKPLILSVGPRMLYVQAHIPGSEYVGQGSSPEGIANLQARVKSLPRNKFMVLYCGCCPWSHCPNVRPAFSALHVMGFTNVKVLYIADNFGRDWVDKGYPSAKGE
jgi:hypothetical protein